MTSELYDPKEHLIHALDTRDMRVSDERMTRLAGLVPIFKTGLKTYLSMSTILVALRERGFKFMFDFKFHDIPDQVGDACAQVASMGAWAMTVHTAGGPAMLKAAVEGAAAGAQEACQEPPLVLGITVLTSHNDQTLQATGIHNIEIAELVSERAELARMCELGGVVCSPNEAALVRKIVGPGMKIVCPGIRPAGDSADDQERVSTPRIAVLNGADYLVIGRSIGNAVNPVAAVEAIHRDMCAGYAERLAPQV